MNEILKFYCRPQVSELFRTFVGVISSQLIVISSCSILRDVTFASTSNSTQRINLLP